MPYTISKLDNEPIAVLTIDHALNSREEGMAMGHEIGATLKRCGDHMHLILDYSTLDMSFSVIIMSLAAALIGDGDEVIKLTDPRLIIRIVGSNAMAKLWATAMRQAQYGSKEVLLFETVGAAVIDARKEEAEINPAPEVPDIEELTEPITATAAGSESR